MWVQHCFYDLGCFSGGRMNERQSVIHLCDDTNMSHFSYTAVRAGKKNDITRYGLLQIYFFSDVGEVDRTSGYIDLKMIEYIHHES